MDSPTLGDLANEYFDLLASRKAQEEVLTDIEKRINELGQVLIGSLDEHKVGSVTTNAGTLKIQESVVPHVTNWDAYYEFIHENKFYHLLERRPSITGCRELFEQGAPVPGAEPFTRRVLRSKKS